jgi:hypothetical protein
MAQMNTHPARHAMQIGVPENSRQRRTGHRTSARMTIGRAGQLSADEGTKVNGRRGGEVHDQLKSMGDYRFTVILRTELEE